MWQLLFVLCTGLKDFLQEQYLIDDFLELWSHVGGLTVILRHDALLCSAANNVIMQFKLLAVLWMLIEKA